jgi:peptide/nickel transport system ATP-binding protein
MGETLLKVTDLKKHFPVGRGLLGKATGYVKAVDGVSFTINTGESLGLVGESGSGKTTLGKTIMRLYEKTAGQVLYRDVDIFTLKKPELRSLRPKMQYIFQDPYSSLNPRMQIGDAIAEPLLQHGLATKAEVSDKVGEALSSCGLKPCYVDRFPHEFSGGQRQRVVLARAIALHPEFIIADEPVSALDVSIQAQIINLFSDLQEKHGLSYLFISHDLSVVEHLCLTTAIIYLGIIVESAKSSELFSHPLHPYTKALLSAIPIPDPTFKKQQIVLKGDIPSPFNPPIGCRFHTRCSYAQNICSECIPELQDMGSGHLVACHRIDQI